MALIILLIAWYGIYYFISLTIQHKKVVHTIKYSRLNFQRKYTFCGILSPKKWVSKNGLCICVLCVFLCAHACVCVSVCASVCGACVGPLAPACYHACDQTISKTKCHGTLIFDILATEFLEIPVRGYGLNRRSGSTTILFRFLVLRKLTLAIQIKFNISTTKQISYDHELKLF